MSDEKIMRRDIKEFLRKIKEKLPEWLKEKKEHKEILIELEEHIWDKADELSEHGKATEQSVRLALAHMGTPQSIAREYKRRGTPKVYISEELWPLYTRWLIGVLLVIFVLNIVGFVVDVLTGGDASIGFNLITNLLGAFAIVTMIFVGLSMEGYFPEDFKSKTKIKKEAKELEKAKEKGLPISKKTGKPMKLIVKPGEKIAGGIFNLIFGIILLTQPLFPEFVALIDPGFLLILKVIGLFSIIEGVISITRGALGNTNVSGQQVTLVCMALLKFASLPLIWWIMNSVGIFPIPYTENFIAGPWQVILIAPEYHEAFRNICIVIMVVQVCSATYDIYKAGTLVKYKL